MELLFIPLFFFYIATLLPDLFASPFPLILFFFIPLVLSLRWQKLDLFSICTILVLFLFCDGYDKRTLNLSFSPELCDGYFCKIISQPVGRERRKKGFSVSLIAQKDTHGNVYSSSGVLYAIGNDMDMNIFDIVYLSGNIDDGLLMFSSSDIVRKNMFSDIRKKIITLIRRRMYSSRSSELMQLLILGSSDFGSITIGEKASLSGLRHVIALSGMHLAALSILLSPLKIISKSIYRFVEMFSMALFTFLSGWRPSLLRAFIFRSLAKFGFKVDQCFILSAILLLFVFPYYAFDLGAIYSFIALSGILIVTPYLSESLSCLLPKGMSLLLSTSISALLFSIPISLHTFGYYQLFSILTSISIGPLVLAYMILSIIYLFVPSLESFTYIAYRAIDLILSINIVPVQNGIECYLVLVMIVFIFMSKVIYTNHLRHY